MAKPRTHYDFAREIIEGTGGMNDYEEYEKVVWHESDRVAASAWTLRCLANPNCKGSQEVLDLILATRAEAEAESTS